MVAERDLNFHILTVGWGRRAIEQLWNRIEDHSGIRFSHVVHPKYTGRDSREFDRRSNIFFFNDQPTLSLPAADRRLLASLEGDDLPTLHNMILGDRVVSKLAYDEALRYATFLALRLRGLFEAIKPTVVIGGFDAIHSGVGCAVARRSNIPWFALNFSVIPPGLACLCGGMSPATRAFSQAPSDQQVELAKATLERFERREVQAPAYIAPRSMPIGKRVRRLPRRFSGIARFVHRSRQREDLRFVEAQSGHDIRVAIRKRLASSSARRALAKTCTLTKPPAGPFIFFGLHMQPESSIDVWAPFYSNQMWVIELLSRSIPPTHRLCVKIHKSDVSNYSLSKLQQMHSFPGVELVAPFADTRSFLEKADLVIAIQGTIGLEAALLGKPVLMLGDSPVTVFPGVSPIGELSKLPALIRQKLDDVSPSRDEIAEAYASFLSPFSPASHNDWTAHLNEDAIVGYGNLFAALKGRVQGMA